MFKKTVLKGLNPDHDNPLGDLRYHFIFFIGALHPRYWKA